MSLANLTKPAVEAALDEFDAIGRDAFMPKYGFADAKRYWLVRNGRRYPSKAIAGVAHKFVTGEPLPASAFSGGESAVGRKLRQLGFELDAPARNPDWTRDELVLALDLYLDHRESPPAKDSEPVAALSDVLNKMHRLNGSIGSATLRNANGVYLKLMNLRSADPAYTSQGKVGMTRRNALEAVLWAELENRREALFAEAHAIRAAVLNADEVAVSKLPSVEPYEGEEGGTVVRLHKRYERDPRLVAEKRKAAKAAGDLSCEVCGFDFETAYGLLGADFIEVHHTRPVHTMKPGHRTKLTDLALLCANCHRMAHRKRIPLTLDEVRTSLQRPTR